MNIAQRECFVPESLDLEYYIQQNDMQGIHHLARYTWAMQAIRKLGAFKTVLEYGSGAGYGSYLLAKEFPESSFLAMDYDPVAIGHAREHYRLPNLRYETADTRQWQPQLQAAPADLIISFDVIEHVNHRELFFYNLVHYLAPGGTMFLSTPCGGAQTLANPGWEHHKIEYNALHLYDYLRRYFGEIVRPDDDNPEFPALEVFTRLRDLGISYKNVMNPVVLRAPILVDNPYLAQGMSREVQLGADATPGADQVQGQNQEALTQQVVQLNAARARDQEHIANLEQALRDFENSTSWKLTAPLRQLALFARTLREGRSHH